MESRQIVLEVIDWIIEIAERITKKYPQFSTKDERVKKDVDVLTLNNIFSSKCLGKLIKWPNKYKPQRATDTPVSLIDRCIENEMVIVPEFLKSFWRVNILREQRQKLIEIKREQANRRALEEEWRQGKARVSLYHRTRSFHVKSNTYGGGGSSGAMTTMISRRSSQGQNVSVLVRENSLVCVLFWFLVFFFLRTIASVAY